MYPLLPHKDKISQFFPFGNTGGASLQGGKKPTGAPLHSKTGQAGKGGLSSGQSGLLSGTYFAASLPTKECPQHLISSGEHSSHFPCHSMSLHPLHFKTLPFLKGSDTLLLLSTKGWEFSPATHETLSSRAVSARIPVFLSDVIRDVPQEVRSYLMPGARGDDDLAKAAWEMATTRMEGLDGYVQAAVFTTGEQQYFFGITKEMAALPAEALLSNLQEAIQEAEFTASIPSPSGCAPSVHEAKMLNCIWPTRALSEEELVKTCVRPRRKRSTKSSSYGKFAMIFPEEGSAFPTVSSVPEAEADHATEPDLPLNQEVQELLRHIERIKEKYGITIEDIARHVNQSVAPSRIRITPSGQIRLLSPGAKEERTLDLDILSRAVYILYLRHPEGIGYKYLQDHKTELYSIYAPISNKSDKNEIKNSVELLVDPLSEKICIHVARIKAAFKNLMAEDLAANYYIKGPQGERKSISLDRSLVIWDQNPSRCQTAKIS